MLTSERKSLLLSRLKAEGRIVAKELSAELDVSEDTIRRDLRELAAEGLVQRVHGGALPRSETIKTLQSRRSVAISEKIRLAQVGAALIQSGARIFIDGGTTHVELVRALPLTTRATVVTHSPTIATALEFHQDIELIVVGGRIYRHSMVAVGAEPILTISRMRFDMCFVGVTALDSKAGLMTGDFEEAAIKRAFIAQSASVVALVTMDKLGAHSPFQIDGVSCLKDIVITKEAPAPHLPKGIKVHRAL